MFVLRYPGGYKQEIPAATVEDDEEVIYDFYESWYYKYTRRQFDPAARNVVRTMAQTQAIRERMRRRQGPK